MKLSMLLTFQIVPRFLRGEEVLLAVSAGLKGKEAFQGVHQIKASFLPQLVRTSIGI